MQALSRSVLIAVAVQCMLALTAFVAANMLVGVESRIREISDLAAAQRQQFLELRSTRQRLVAAIKGDADQGALTRLQTRLRAQIDKVRSSSERIHDNLRANADLSFLIETNTALEIEGEVLPVLDTFLTELRGLTETEPSNVAARLGKMDMVATSAFASVSIVGGFEEIARETRAAGSRAILLVKDMLALIQLSTVVVVLLIAIFIIRPAIRAQTRTLERETRLREQLEHSSRELQDHRDHLQQLVDERTRTIVAQADELQRALDVEKELNGLQRQFVSMVCHEFRTPLAIIDGSAQRILRRGDRIEPDRLKGTLEKIRTSVLRLTDLMESVLSAARLEAGTIKFDPMPSAPRDIVLEIVANYQDLNQDHHLIVDIDALPELFLMDAKLIRQVISNLISNAIKYSPAGTRVWIDGGVSDDGGMTLSVRDEGVGIPPAEVQSLFERFFRASTSTGIAGTGIGLNMAKALVDMHGGTIDVTSEEGVGTEFSIYLPAQRQISEEQQVSETQPA